MTLRYIHQIILSIFAVALSALLTGCADDFPERNFGPTGEGEVTIEAAVDFRPMAGALSRAAGNSISEIDKIWVLLYNIDGNLVFSTQLDRTDVTISSENRTDSDTGTEFDRAEDKTERAKFKLTVPYGHYRMYAVANVGNIERYSNEISSETGLKAIRFNWNNEDVTANSQMFGFFSPEGESWTGSEAPIVRIDGSTRTLCAWIKRVASKVTVAFDGSKLRKGVSIYIKSVSIKDIPYSSQLGEGNAVKSTDSPQYAPVHSSQTIVYGEGSMDQAEALWPCITKENPSGDPDISSDHSATADALFFFENMQGTGIGKEKWQDADGDGKVDYPGANDPASDDFKDNKDGRSLGTYIEVEAFYKANLFDNSGSGRIVYRFMLGKDTERDYNAERNHHYKLTLQFNGNANDVDWHIDYTKEPGIFVPVPYYISYIYNESLNMPVTIIGEIEGELSATIDPAEEQNKYSWAPFEPDAEFDYYKGTLYNPGPWNGFLSLRGVKDPVITPPAGQSWTGNYNQTYWNDHHRGERTYKTTPSDKPYEEGSVDGSYTVTKEGNGLLFHIPLYTRAKQLIKETAYTGNNVFTAYRRKAIVTFKAKIKGYSEPFVTKAEIIQVERVVNPKGIWRSSTNTDEFHVELKIRKKESDTKFINLESEGPWTATFETGADYFEMSSDNSAYGSTPITGLTGSDVQFYVRPKSAIGEKDVRCGVVKVTYHDNSCVHRIYLRQGYAPLDVVGDGIQWHSYNMYAAEQETLSPLEEGSLFKFGNWNDAILAENNIDKGYGVAPGSYEFRLASGESKKWADIPPCGPKLDADSVHKLRFSAPTTMGANVRVAKFSDYKSIYSNTNISYGYGVLYGDGATKTAEDQATAYGYMRSGSSTSSTAGMRGCFICNSTDGRNIFFPIGASGYGHRKSQYDENVDNGYGGVLRYASRSHVMTEYDRIGKKSYSDVRPLFYDVYRSNGAVYYLQGCDTGLSLPGSDLTSATAWDINYHTFDFYSYWTDATSCKDGAYGMQKNSANINGPDAGFLRCVTDNSSK